MSDLTRTVTVVVCLAVHNGNNAAVGFALVFGRRVLRPP